jgi:hypothetical protein
MIGIGVRIAVHRENLGSFLSYDSALLVDGSGWLRLRQLGMSPQSVTSLIDPAWLS